MKLRIKLIVGLIIGLIIILIISFTYTSIGIKVLSVIPENNSRNIPQDTVISVTFSQAINPNTLKIKFDPSIEYSLEITDNNSKVLLKPEFLLTQGETYTLVIDEPVSFKSNFTIQPLPLNQQQGQSYEYRSGSEEIAKKELAASKKWVAISELSKKLPLTFPTFSVRYVSKTNEYIVELLGDQTNSRNDFLSWLNSQNINIEDIDVIYTQNSTGDFAISSISLTNKPLGVIDPIRASFTDPIKTGTLNVVISPNVEFTIKANRDRTQLEITPNTTWGYGRTLTLTFKNNISSEDDITLGKDYSYTFKTIPYSGI